MLAQPYQAAYVPAGLDTAFPTALNVFPAEDYTSGSIAGSARLPRLAGAVRADPAPLRRRRAVLRDVALHAGNHPGVVVVHGFNTHGYDSVVRWAAMLYANGYDVIAADQRDFAFEYNDAASTATPNGSRPSAGRSRRTSSRPASYLKSRPGVALGRGRRASARARRTRCSRSRQDAKATSSPPG